MKILLAGDGNTGKTTFLNYLTKKDTFNYIPTIGVNVVKLDGHKFWDCAGVEKNGGLRDGYYINADFAIIFCSFLDRKTIKNISSWRRDITRTCENIKVFYIFNNYSPEHFRYFQFVKYRLMNLKDNVLNVYKASEITDFDEIYKDMKKYIPPSFFEDEKEEEEIISTKSIKNIE